MGQANNSATSDPFFRDEANRCFRQQQRIRTRQVCVYKLQRLEAELMGQLKKVQRRPRLFDLNVCVKLDRDYYQLTSRISGSIMVGIIACRKLSSCSKRSPFKLWGWSWYLYFVPSSSCFIIWNIFSPIRSAKNHMFLAFRHICGKSGDDSSGWRPLEKEGNREPFIFTDGLLIRSLPVSYEPQKGQGGKGTSTGVLDQIPPRWFGYFLPLCHDPVTGIPYRKSSWPHNASSYALYSFFPFPPKAKGEWNGIFAVKSWEPIQLMQR